MSDKMNKRQVAVKIINNNPAQSFSKVAEKIAEKIEVPLVQAKSYFKYIVKNGLCETYKATDTPWADEKAAKKEAPVASTRKKATQMEASAAPQRARRANTAASKKGAKKVGKRKAAA